MESAGAVAILAYPIGTWDRFWSKVKFGPKCWEWIGAYRAADNYGVFTIKRKCFSAPRVAYEMVTGKIPEGLWMLHSCDNRRCVRPEHLSPGTQKQNLRDCVTRGRHIAPKGEKNGMSKLTAVKVAAVRYEYDGKRGSMTRLAEKNKVAVPTIHGIVRRNSWK